MFAIVGVSSRVRGVYVCGEVRVHRFRSLEIIIQKNNTKKNYNIVSN